MKERTSTLLWLLWLMQLCSNCKAHTTQAVPPDKINWAVTETHESRAKRSVNDGMTFHLHYDESVDKLDSKLIKDIKNDIMPDVVKYFKSAFKVKKPVDNIKVNPACKENLYGTVEGIRHCVDECVETKCADVTVPKEHLDDCKIYYPADKTKATLRGSGGKGVSDVDYLLYISAFTTVGCQGKTVAYAVHCSQDPKTGRPVAGNVNICPEKLDHQPFGVEQVHSTVKHEILHAVLMSPSLFAFYIDDSGAPLNDVDESGRPKYDSKRKTYVLSIIKKVVRQRWEVRGGTVEKEVAMLVTPKVVKEVRNHFKCDRLEGAELEEFGVKKEQYSHWEKRLFDNEIMVNTYSRASHISRITLALAEDSGWYTSNYDMATRFTFGKGLGCDFAMKSCYSWLKNNKNTFPYCKPEKAMEKTSCDEQHHSVGLCQVVKYSNRLPKMYHQIPEVPGIDSAELDYYGGQVESADYCPMIQPFSELHYDEFVRSSVCTVSSNTEANIGYNVYMEKFGPTSRCFIHNSRWNISRCNQNIHNPRYGSGCYETKCIKNVGLKIFVNGEEYKCKPEGGNIIKIATQNEYYRAQGGIVCPPCQEICGGEICDAALSGKDKLDTSSESRGIRLFNGDPPCKDLPKKTRQRTISGSGHGVASLITIFICLVIVL